MKFSVSLSSLFLLFQSSSVSVRRTLLSIQYGGKCPTTVVWAGWETRFLDTGEFRRR